MNKEKSIEVLNTLIEINNDRIAGYEIAIEETDEADLKTLFIQLKQTSQKCNIELAAEVRALGGSPVLGTREIGDIHKAWMDLNALIKNNDRIAIFHSCEYAEGITMDTYNDALKNNTDMTAKQKMLLNAQCMLIKADQDKVYGIREMLSQEV
jgi:uncharacterized protein (TIGR02284 family)